MGRIISIRKEPLSNHKGKDREEWDKMKKSVALVHRKTTKELQMDKWWDSQYGD